MLVMVAGLELGGGGNMTPDLDNKIWRVAQLYQVVVKHPTDICGFTRYDYQSGQTVANWQAGNTCMDDYAIAASGFAWKAAYSRLTGRDWYPARWNAVDMIHQTFNTNDALCIYDSSQPFDALKGPCNSVPSALGAGKWWVNVISLNHGNQTPAYGIGLMANIAAAFIGLDVASASVITNGEISNDEKTAMQFIYKEGQDKSFLNQNGKGEFSARGCYLTSPWTTDGFPCWDYIGRPANDAYKAGMYPIFRFYQRYGFTPGDAGGFQFTASQFDPGYFASDFYHVGRYETYYSLGYSFIDTPPQLAPGVQPRLAFLTPNGMYYMNASRGGGYGQTVIATSTSTSDYTSNFNIVDLNGGTLNEGDPVAIKCWANPAFYLSAQNGGGGLITPDATSIGSNETFRIHKLGGIYFYGPIANGDWIALQTANGLYLHIDGDGGSTITANASSSGPHETFTYTKIDDPFYGGGRR